MIYINFNIDNPWSKYFKTLKVVTGKLFGNKFWEIQIMRTSDIVCFKFNFTTNQDHAGIVFEIGLLSINANFTVYDNRHWDQDKQQWKIY